MPKRLSVNQNVFAVTFSRSIKEKCILLSTIFTQFYAFFFSFFCRNVDTFELRKFGKVFFQFGDNFQVGRKPSDGVELGCREPAGGFVFVQMHGIRLQ